MMRRKDKQITDAAGLDAVFQAGSVCHLALEDGPAPYVVPLSYGYEDGVLYFHGAAEGKKLDLARKNPAAGFCISRELALVKGESACNWGVQFESVIGTGSLEILESAEEKRHALDVLMNHYGWQGPGEYSDKSLMATSVMALRIREVSGKGSPRH